MKAEAANSEPTAVVACPSCSTANRVPAAAKGIPHCAKCKTALPWLTEAGDGDFQAVALEAPVAVLVDLWAPWCGPCRMVSPAVERLAATMAGRLKVVKVNVDHSPGISRRYGVQGIPTLLLLEGGKLISQQVGAVPEAALERWVNHAIESA